MKKRLFSAILAAVMLFAAAGCTGKPSDNGETTSVRESGSVAADAEKNTTADAKNDVFTLKIYTDKNSESYKALDEPKMSFETGIDTINNGYIRFVCDEDDVEVTLVGLSYNDFRNEFDEIEPLFSIKTTKGFVYEFKGDLGETMPTAKLKAKKGNYGAEFLLQMNGRDESTDFTIKAADMNG